MWPLLGQIIGYDVLVELVARSRSATLYEISQIPSYGVSLLVDVPAIVRSSSPIVPYIRRNGDAQQ